MKKIVDYRKLLGVHKTVELKELKTVYRNFMKDLHPDKFNGDEEGKLEAAFPAPVDRFRRARCGSHAPSRAPPFRAAPCPRAHRRRS